MGHNPVRLTQGPGRNRGTPKVSPNGSPKTPKRTDKPAIPPKGKAKAKAKNKGKGKDPDDMPSEAEMDAGLQWLHDNGYIQIEGKGDKVSPAARVLLRPYRIVLLIIAIWFASSIFCIVSRLILMMFE